MAASFDNPTVPPQSAPRDREPGTLLTAAGAGGPAPDPTVPEARRPSPAAPPTDPTPPPPADITQATPAEAEPATAEADVTAPEAEAVAEAPAEGQNAPAEAETAAAEADVTVPEAEALPEAQEAAETVTAPPAEAEPVAAEADVAAPEAEAIAEAPAEGQDTPAEAEPVAADAVTEAEPAAAQADVTAPEAEAIAEAPAEDQDTPAEAEPVAAQADVTAPEAEAVAEAPAAGQDAPVEAETAEAQGAAVAAAVVKREAAGVAGAYRAAGQVLRAKGKTGARAKVYLVLDRSGSMRPFYKDGSAQFLADHTLALAAHLDAGATVHTVFFSTDVDGTADLTLASHDDAWVEARHAELGRMGRTSYHVAVEAVLERYQQDGGTGPALVVFQTDGAPDNRQPARQAITDAAASAPDVHWQFVAFGDHENKAFDFLRKLDAENAGFFHAGPAPAELTPAALLKGLLQSY
ncbi:VWA domain-containing protein [Streptomyces goshikiensis]|uniref:VWA domain-containing protein n=1 Tax=Streptomyces goshikiensis TaxID=1942 RepID=UPI0036768956